MICAKWFGVEIPDYCSDIMSFPWGGFVMDSVLDIKTYSIYCGLVLEVLQIKPVTLPEN